MNLRDAEQGFGRGARVVQLLGQGRGLFQQRQGSTGFPAKTIGQGQLNVQGQTVVRVRGLGHLLQDVEQRAPDDLGLAIRSQI